MRSSHGPSRVSARFDDPNLVAYGGLEPVVRLAERCDLGALASELVRLPKSKDGTGAFVAAKLMTLVAGMAAGADSIDARPISPTPMMPMRFTCLPRSRMWSCAHVGRDPR